MVKKFGIAAAVAAAVMMAGAPAFADGGANNAYNGQVGLVNLNDIDILKDINVNAVLGLCNNNLGILGAAVPVLSPQVTGSCAAGGIVD